MRSTSRHFVSAGLPFHADPFLTSALVAAVGITTIDSTELSGLARRFVLEVTFDPRAESGQRTLDGVDENGEGLLRAELTLLGQVFRDQRDADGRSTASVTIEALPGSRIRGTLTGTLVDPLTGEDQFAGNTEANEDGVFSFGAGGGIVVDSSAEAEWAELLLKAHAFAMALDVNLESVPQETA